MSHVIQCKISITLTYMSIYVRRWNIKANQDLSTCQTKQEVYHDTIYMHDKSMNGLSSKYTIIFISLLCIIQGLTKPS